MDNNNKSCGISNVKSALPASPQNAMAYVPFQLDSREFSVEEALKNGTLFCTRPGAPCAAIATQKTR